MLNAFENIDAYKEYFLDQADGLPIIGQSNDGIIALGKACRKAMLRNSPLTAAELETLSPATPKKAVI